MKVGDVNQSFVPDPFAGDLEDRNQLALGFSTPSQAATGANIEIPVFMQQPADLAAFQTVLRYDPNQLNVKDVRWAKSVTADPKYQWAAWHRPQPGELRLTWFDAEGKSLQLSSGSLIFSVLAEKIGSTALDAALLLRTDYDSEVASEAYAPSGERYGLSLNAVSAAYQPLTENAPVATAKAPSWQVSVYPNPAHSAFKIELVAPADGAATLTISDVLGRTVAEYPLALHKGNNTLTSAQLPKLTAGQYVLRFDTPFGSQTLRLVKQD